MEGRNSVPESDEALIQAVQDAYSARARATSEPSYSERIAGAFGYSPQELQAIPAASHMGLSCGNPVAAASIRERETVLDLGSGGGIDVFLAASKVGPRGHAIGLDMSPDMIKRARNNAKSKNLRSPHVAFVQAHLTEPLPIASESVDCILSNCVINLLPTEGKAHLLKEVSRVLKPGGRVVLDDIVAKMTLPDNIRNDLASYVGCISGAIQTDQYQDLLIAAGLQDIVFVDTRGDINIYYQEDAAAATRPTCCEPLTPSRTSKPTPDFDANKWVASYQIYALKPTSTDLEVPSVKPPYALLRWWDAYPAVQSTSIPQMFIQDLAGIIRDSTRNDYAVIDVRRNDHAGGHVRGSFQCPAQTFYDDLEKFHEQFRDIEKVIFYCGSSNGRGPRCAGWYQDHLTAQGNNKSNAYILQGGIKAWLEEFGDREDLVDKDPVD